MSYDSGFIKVTHEVIGTAQGDVNGAVATTTQHLEDLSKQVNALIELWQGDSSTSYSELQRKWNVAAGDLRDMLRMIGEHLGRTNTAYADGEKLREAVWASA